VTDPIRIVIGGDRALVREGVVRMVERAGFPVVGTAADARELVDVVRAPSHAARRVRP
jgi:DNA-binding NarL/FixJ family response regulator